MSESQEGAGEGLALSPRTGCLISLLLGLVGVALVFAIGTLVTQREIVFGRGQPVETRLWLVSSEGNQGLAFSRGRVVEGDLSGQEVCVQTRVRFLLWRRSGPAQNTEYCECYAREAGRWVYTGACEP